MGHTSKSQATGDKENPFGEGIADIKEFVFPPGVIAPDFVDNKIDTAFSNYTSILKGLKILNKNVIDSSLLVPKVKNDTSKNKDNIVVTHLKITVQSPPSYLID